ncbi:MAG: DUF5703 domain-containing protein [Mariniphaga sp.]
MRKKYDLVLLWLLLGVAVHAKTKNDPLKYDIVWTTPSDNSSGSMPLRNGDLGVNVRIVKTGDLPIKKAWHLINQ